jgi:Tfp pilus assembly protein PilZ
MGQRADDPKAAANNSAVDRRSTPRALARLGVRFGSRDQLAQAMKATTHNIGLGGLCLLTTKEYKTGTLLQVVIELENEPPLELSAIVAWAKPGRAVGVRFDSLDETQRQRLAEVVRRHASTPDNGEGP